MTGDPNGSYHDNPSAGKELRKWQSRATLRAHTFYPMADKFNSMISGTPSAEAMSHIPSLRARRAEGVFRHFSTLAGYCQSR